MGEIKNRVEDTTSKEVEKWTPAYENYTFIENGDKTKLEIDIEMDLSEDKKEMIKMFEVMWPQALLKLKEICEK